MFESQSKLQDKEIRDIIDAARNVWIRRLIDYSRSNSLLFYRDLKVGTLDLSANIKAVTRLLEGHPVTIEELIITEHNIESAVSTVPAKTKTDQRQRVRNALIALQRKALSNLEEKGIDTLHLALGMATWQAADGGRPYNAPILLLPVRIEARGRISDVLRLIITGEPQLNPVLLYVLETEYRISINPSDILNKCSHEEESGQWNIMPECVFAKLEHTIKTTVGDFTIVPRTVVANFQFAKMAMVEDLKKHGTAMTSSTIVAAIAGHIGSRQKLAETTSSIEPKQLDGRPASNDHLVLDADSTQHRVVVIVGSGQNCVVQGPPGTGKSQTIANLIVQSVAEGLRVLFVAEKRAALDAVVKRLSHPNVGLGHLILDLHGASVSRKEVMKCLGQILEQVRYAKPVDGESIHQEFEARRKQLNEHARRMNQVQQPTGLSVNRMIGKLLRLPPSIQSTVRLRGATLAALTAKQAEEVKEWIRTTTPNPKLLLGTDPSPWNNADIRDGYKAQEMHDLTVRLAYEFWPAFEKHLTQMVQYLGIRWPKTLAETATLLTLIHDVQDICKQYEVEVFSTNPGALAQALQPATQGVVTRSWSFVTNRAYRFARGQLLALRSSKATVSVLWEEVVRIADVLHCWHRFDPISQIPLVVKDEKQFMETFITLNEGITALGTVIEKEFGAFDTLPLSEVASQLRRLADDRRTPSLLPTIHEARSHFKQVGLSPLLDDIREHNIPVGEWEARFDYIWLCSALEQVLASDPNLASFNGRTHEEVVADFTKLDLERTRLAASRVGRIHAEGAIKAMDQYFEEANLIRAEARKKSRHISLRELLARAPHVLTRLAPCWVVSPLSVSQLLDGNNCHFDLVIFDEASQILQEEAVPSLYRARQVVVAGDRHQLPPTTFFATTIEGEDGFQDDSETQDVLTTAKTAIGGFESLLDTLEVFLPSWRLEWHYRSEDERLITFSNTHIYEGHLVTFPGIQRHEAIRHILVPHDPSLGGQEDSSSREVEKVVQQVLEHARTRHQESLGVITMGIKHANRIQAALDRALEQEPDLIDFFSLDRDERFFVKNLETVQGDERDAIILSVGYGKTVNGDLPHRFGPLTQEGGYRRLNVAITRAKRRMCVISSFSHYEIDLNRSNSRGVQLLKAYLEYAAGGGSRLTEEERAGEVASNEFEQDVQDALAKQGIKTRSQFGASRYRIDLVAMHPQQHGRPVLAIECDGASYHSSATARDRDRLRQAHLRRLGWHFHRIWSTDWFYNRDQEIARVVSAYEEAVRRVDSLNIEVIPQSYPDNVKPNMQELQHPIARQRGPQPRVAGYTKIGDYSDQELQMIAGWLISDGLLRTDEELIREIFKNLPFQKLTKPIRERLQKVVKETKHKGTERLV